MQALVSLLTYGAFRPDYLDVEEPLALRFRARKSGPFGHTCNRLVVISAGRMHWRAALAVFDRAGRPAFSAVSVSPSLANREAATGWLRTFATAHRARHAAVGIGHGFAVSAMSAVPRLSDVQTLRLLRTDAARLLGETGNPQDLHAIVHHPLVESSCLRFTLRPQELASVRDLCHSAGLEIARVVCEQAQLLELAYAHLADLAAETRALLLALPASFLFVQLDEGGWQGVTYDPSLDEQAIGALLQAAGTAIPPGGQLAYLDAGMPGMTDLLHSLAGFAPRPVARDLPLPSFHAIALN